MIFLFKPPAQNSAEPIRLQHQSRVNSYSESCRLVLASILADSAMDSRSCIKNSCRICGRQVDSRSRQTLFSATGVQDKLAERVSAVTGVAVRKDELSEFICKNYASDLDRYSLKNAR